VRVTTISCCRCKSPIAGGHSIITFEAGDLTKTRDDPIDLCSDCSNEFIDFLKAAPFKLVSSPDGVGNELRTQG
jgi:hypothetical protein